MKKNSAKLHLPSLLKNTAFLLILLGLSISPAFAACHTVSPTGSGAKTGADWNNAFANLPATLVRGDIYYLADGNYGHSLNLSTPASGTQTIEFRKAQSYDNCTSVGWNTATMGSAQAVWNWGSAGEIVNVGSDGYYIFNGNGKNAGTTEVGCGGVEANPPSSLTGPPPNPAACGIKIDASTCTSSASNGCTGGVGEMGGEGAGIIWESVEWKGQGLNSSGNNNSEPYFWLAGSGSLANVIIAHSYLHNAGTTYFTTANGGWENGSFDHNYVWGSFDGSENHGEPIQVQGSNGETTPDNIDHNIFRDMTTNGDVVATISGTVTYNFYDNADICSAGATCRHNDGVIGCFGTQVCSHVNVYNNTFAYGGTCGFNIGGGNGSVAGTITMKNNIFYNCTNVLMVNGPGGTNTIDYNSYLNSNQSAVGAHDVSSSSAPNPFSNVNSGVQLSSENALWSNRLSLGSPYDALDLYGNSFTTDRGAAQGGTNKLGVPTNLGGTATPQ